MDIRETVRINKLVNEFKKHGIANEEDAVRQATRAVSRESVNSSEEVSQATLNIINRKISYLSDLSNKRIKEEVDKVRLEMGSILSELRALKDTVRNMTSRATVIEQKTSNTENKEEGIKKKAEEKQKPRSGDYQPGDIDIQKVFYCGKK